MTADRANPFANLGEFQPKQPPKSVPKEEIARLAEETGFPSRQAQPVRPAAPTEPPPKKGRRYVTGRNRQINIKATQETIERLYRFADEQHMPLGQVLEIALDALDRQRPSLNPTGETPL